MSKPPITISEVDIPEITKASQVVPEIPINFDISERLLPVPHLCLLATVDGSPAGYKLGYQRTPERFYSWMGGVAPAFRRQGIAQAFLDHQEAWALRQGYRTMEVKSMNKYPAMLQFLIRNHYLIYGVEASEEGTKILFEKELSNP